MLSDRIRAHKLAQVSLAALSIGLGLSTQIPNQSLPVTLAETVLSLAYLCGSFTYYMNLGPKVQEYDEFERKPQIEYVIIFQNPNKENTPDET